MAKKAVGAEEEEGQETEEEGKEKEEGEQKLSAAEKRAVDAEARAEAAERKSAELESARGRAEAKNEPPAGGYTVASFSEAEWTEAEANTGQDRKAILFSLNQQVRTKKEVRDTVGNLETKLAIR